MEHPGIVTPAGSKIFLLTLKLKTMKFRFTITELLKKDDSQYLSDLQLIRALISERQSGVTNPYAPLSERLNSLYKTVNKAIEQGRKEI